MKYLLKINEYVENDAMVKKQSEIELSKKLISWKNISDSYDMFSKNKSTTNYVYSLSQYVFVCISGCIFITSFIVSTRIPHEHSIKCAIKACANIVPSLI